MFVEFDDNYYQQYFKNNIDQFYEIVMNYLTQPFTHSTLRLLNKCVNDQKPSEELVQRICQVIAETLDEEPNPNEACQCAYSVIENIMLHYEDYIHLIIDSEQFQTGRIAQGCILILIHHHYKEPIYTTCLNMLTTMYSQQDSERYFFLNDFNVLLCDVFPALCRANEYKIDDMMIKMCNTISLLLDYAKNDAGYEEISAFLDALNDLIHDNEGSDVQILEDLIVKSKL